MDSNLPPLEQKIAIWEAELERLTGRKLLAQDRYSRQSAWHRWSHESWGVTELRLVVAHIRKRYGKTEYLPNMLTFKYLIPDVSRFNEHLENARDAVRNARPVLDAKARVLLAANRPPQEAVGGERKIGEILESRAFQDFQKLKELL